MRLKDMVTGDGLWYKTKAGTELSMFRSKTSGRYVLTLVPYKGDTTRIAMEISDELIDVLDEMRVSLNQFKPTRVEE